MKCELGAYGCQQKRWKIRPIRNKNFASDNIRDVRFVADQKPFIASSRFAGFVSEGWPTKGKYRVFGRPVGRERGVPNANCNYRGMIRTREEMPDYDSK